jgi:hypothetical protein
MPALSRNTERRIVFKRGDFIKFVRENTIILGSIENIFVHEVLHDERRLFAVTRAATEEEIRDEITGAVLKTMGSARYIVGLPAIRGEQIYAVPVVEVESGELALGKTGWASVTISTSFRYDIDYRDNDIVSKTSRYRQAGTA